MHELSIIRNVVEIVRDEANGAAVQRIKLSVGELSAVMPNALNFCFEALRDDVGLAGAKLEIEQVPGRARCRGCGVTYAMPATGARCECGSMDYQLLAGDELKIVEIEVA